MLLIVSEGNMEYPCRKVLEAEDHLEPIETRHRDAEPSRMAISTRQLRLSTIPKNSHFFHRNTYANE